VSAAEVHKTGAAFFVKQHVNHGEPSQTERRWFTMQQNTQQDPVVGSQRARELLGGDRPLSKQRFFKLVKDGEIETYLEGRHLKTVTASIEARRKRLIEARKSEPNPAMGRLREMAFTSVASRSRKRNPTTARTA